MTRDRGVRRHRTVLAVGVWLVVACLSAVSVAAAAAPNGPPSPAADSAPVAGTISSVALPQTETAASDVAAGPDGAMWFTSRTTQVKGAVGRISSQGVVTTFPDDGIDNPTGIAAGPDGAMWFTNFGPSTQNTDGWISRITTEGVITHFTQTGLGRPWRIVAGPDGALWFTIAKNVSPNTNIESSIGRITVEGVFTFYTDASLKRSYNITAGPDGALWFTNLGFPDDNIESSIGRITTVGVISNYTHADIDQVMDITAGPDGALWFTNRGWPHSSPSIGRITTDGVVSKYTDPHLLDPALGLTGGIAPGPDGALWFTGLRLIGRITTSGTISTFPDSTLTNPDAIAPGPDGAMWFVNDQAGTIGRIQVMGAPSAPRTVTATQTGAGATVSWATPGADGGSAITGYTVTATPGGATCSTAGLSCVVAGLSAGESYTFRVMATNTNGPGTASQPSNSVTVVMATGDPFGVIDTLAGTLGSFTVSGWTIDPDTAESINVAVYVDGVGVSWFPAADARPDVANVYPGYGSNHGFNLTIDATGGPHEVCVFAINSGPGTTNPLLGCGSVTVPTGNPFGVIDTLSAAPGTFTVSGWTIDPDTAESINVAVYVDGVGVSWFPAGAARPDVANVYPGYGSNHGFDLTINATGGSHEVCLFAINSGPGTTNPLLGCRSVVLPTGAPFGAFDTLVGNAGSFTTTGWTIDPDTTESIQVAVYVDGVGVSWFPAGDARPDVAQVYPGYGEGHGFNLTIDATAGTHEVCVLAINTGPANTNPLLGCRTVVVP